MTRVVMEDKGEGKKQQVLMNFIIMQITYEHPRNKIKIFRDPTISLSTAEFMPSILFNN